MFVHKLHELVHDLEVHVVALRENVGCGQSLSIDNFSEDFNIIVVYFSASGDLDLYLPSIGRLDNNVFALSLYNFAGQTYVSSDILTHASRVDTRISTLPLSLHLYQGRVPKT